MHGLAVQATGSASRKRIAAGEGHGSPHVVLV
jgi:hypothetical protein